METALGLVDAAMILHACVSFMLCPTPTLYFLVFALGSDGLRDLFFVCREIEY